ncbi:MAG: hypothetical protein ICCCNLDF_02189 [Planctomycetes bacterium]|nr:hypothetical protein [Planctomycetota bacterium]
MFKPLAVSNRFVAENIATHSASQLAARALAQGAVERGLPVAFTSSLALARSPQSRRELELVADDWRWIAEIPGFRLGSAPGWVKHAATGVPVRVHQAGTPILGGPVCWPDPATDSELYCGIPVLRLNAWLESEIARALNSPAGPCHESNVLAAIVASGATLDRALELHPYVAERYQDLWERARAQQLWTAVA